MPSNNLTSLLSLASASSRIRESQRSQITTASGLGSRTSGFAESTSNSESSQTGNRVSRAPSQTPSTPSRRHRRASSLDSSPISAVPSAPKRQRVGDSQVIVSQEHLERLERNQELILKELAILKGLFASQSPSALTGSKPSQKYSDLASEVVNAFLTTPFSDLFYGSNLASIIHDAAVVCKVGGVPNARHPDRHDFRKEVTRKLTVWRSERKQARYSTYRVGSPLSPKVENFWKVAAKEIFELGELGEKERREVLEFVFREDEARFGAANTGITSVRHLAGLQKEFMEWQAMNRSRMVPVWRRGKEGGNGGYGSEDEEEFGQGRNVDSSARTGEEDEEDGEEDGE
ncbi:hypothetical protein J008_02618 [Cryptococcus neoformans]|nr:hypothetical protein J008_02618 [Cryptococcus neoformans var. grubii]